MVEWRVYSRNFTDFNLGTSVHVHAWLRGKDVSPVVGNYRESWVDINARRPRPPMVERPSEIRVTYVWRQQKLWVPLEVRVMGEIPTGHWGESDTVTVRVEPGVASTPEWVRVFVEKETPAEQPGTWTGWEAGERMWSRQS